MEAADTLHRRILREIEGRILSGSWAPGHRVPSELELAAQYGCSRMTVNKALTQLARAGLIERRKRSGSFVLQPLAESAVLEIPDIEAEVLSSRRPYSFTTLECRVRTASRAEQVLLGLPRPGLDILDVSCMHFAASRPFCLERRLISLVTVPEAADADFSTVPPGRWLLAQLPWTSAEHRIRAVNADAGTAAVLQVPRRAACLLVERRTWSGNGVVTRVELFYPGDGHALLATFTPAASG